MVKQNRSDAKSCLSQKLLKNGLNKVKASKIHLDSKHANC